MSGLIITGLTSAGVTSIIVAIINGLLSRRKMAADTVQTIQETAGDMINSLYREIERLNGEVKGLRDEVSGVRQELATTNRERIHVTEVLSAALRYINDARAELEKHNLPQPTVSNLLREHLEEL